MSIHHICGHIQFIIYIPCPHIKTHIQYLIKSVTFLSITNIVSYVVTE